MAQTAHAPDPTFTLGDYLAKARNLAGLSQQDMADRLLVSRTTVVNWEQGHTRPSDRKIAAWAATTGVRVGWLRQGLQPVIGWSARVPQARAPRMHLRLLGSADNHPALSEFHPSGGHRRAA